MSVSRLGTFGRLRIRPPATAGGGGGGGGGTGDLLLYPSDLTYLGAFRLPNYTDGVGQISYGGSAMAFNAANNSLFITGSGGIVAEFSIPGSLSTSATLTDLPTGTTLQGFRDVSAALPSPLTGATDGSPIGGLLVSGGKLYGTIFAYYSGASTQATSHFVLSSLDLATATVTGLYATGNGTPSARLAAGAMSPIPAAWQTALGHTAMSGASNLSVVSLSSQGPASVGFTPSHVGVSTDADPYVYYPVDHPLGPAYVDYFNPLQCGTDTNSGIVFPDGADSVIYFGSGTAQWVGYGTSAELGDESVFSYGPHSLNGVYANRVWAYRAADFAAVKAGTKQPWEVLPYAAWDFTLPITTPLKTAGNAVYDPATKRIYFSLVNCDHEVGSSALPVIFVFGVGSGHGTGDPVNPKIGCVAAWPAPVGSDPSAVAPGPVTAGTTVNLGAGLVYAQYGATVANVKFYLDANGNGTYEAGVDTFLGTGTGDGNLPGGGSANYSRSRRPATRPGPRRFSPS
jgi:hypothetical protein